MKRPLILVLGLLFAGQAAATENWSSETAHAIAGGLFAGVVTYLADRSDAPEYRAWIGFGTSAAVGVLAELAQGDDASGVDMAANAIGAAIGAFVTDKWLLKPVVKGDDGGLAYVGVETSIDF